MSSTPARACSNSAVLALGLISSVIDLTSSSVSRTERCTPGCRSGWHSELHQPGPTDLCCRSAPLAWLTHPAASFRQNRQPETAPPGWLPPHPTPTNDADSPRLFLTDVRCPGVYARSHRVFASSLTGSTPYDPARSGERRQETGAPPNLLPAGQMCRLWPGAGAIPIAGAARLRAWRPWIADLVQLEAEWARLAACERQVSRAYPGHRASARNNTRAHTLDATDTTPFSLGCSHLECRAGPGSP